jgi:hypothetical protein
MALLISRFLPWLSQDIFPQRHQVLHGRHIHWQGKNHARFRGTVGGRQRHALFDAFVNPDQAVRTLMLFADNAQQGESTAKQRMPGVGNDDPLLRQKLGA